MDRFDLANDFRNFLTKAIELDVLDATDAFVYGHDHANGQTISSIAVSVVETAFASIHCGGVQAHAQLARMSDAIHVRLRGAL